MSSISHAGQVHRRIGDVFEAQLDLLARVGDRSTVSSIQSDRLPPPEWPVTPQPKALPVVFSSVRLAFGRSASVAPLSVETTR